MEDFKFEIKAARTDSKYRVFEPNNPLNRPDIKYGKCIAAIVLFIALIAAVFLLTAYIVKNINTKSSLTWLPWISAAAAAVIYIFCILKKAIIWLVHTYQHFAPDRVRLKCVFEPSCSEYMILSVGKYGSIKGAFKGIRRLCRCKPPGGVDYP